MQTLFVLLTAIIIAIIAKKRGRSPWGWAIVGAIAFLVIDTVIALLLSAVLWNASFSTTEVIYFYAAVKFVLFSIFVAVFQTRLTPATTPHQKEESEQAGKTPAQTRRPEVKQILQHPLNQEKPIENISSIKNETLTSDEMESKRINLENSRELYRKKIFREQGRCETCGHKLGWITKLRGEIYCTKHSQPSKAEITSKPSSSASDPLTLLKSANGMPEIHCQKCGNMIRPEEHFCRICGASLADQIASLAPSGSASELLNQPNRVAQTPEIHCQKCGNMIRPEERFCRICGASLADQAASVEPTLLTGESKSDEGKEVSRPPTQPRLVDQIGPLESTELRTEQTRISLALDRRGYPLISYLSEIPHYLKLARWTGSDYEIETVDASPNVGGFSSLALNSQSYPLISYYDKTNEALKLAEWDGQKWNLELVDDSGAKLGQYTSLALDPKDNLYISYFVDEPNTDYLKVAVRKNGTWNFTSFNSGYKKFRLGWGYHTSIALDAQDNPYVAYFANTAKDLNVQYWLGTTPLRFYVDSGGSVGLYPSIKFIPDYSGQ